MYKQNKDKGFYDKAIDYITIALFWLLASVVGLFFTTGSALSAAFMTAYKMQSNTIEDSLFATYKEFFYKTLIPGTFTFLGVLAASVGLYFLALPAFGNENTLLIVLFYILLAYVLLFVVYAFPIQAIFKHRNPLHLLKNTMLIAHIHPLVSFKQLVNVSVFYILVVVVHPVLLIFALALFFAMQAFQLKPIMDMYIEKISNKEKSENTAQ